MTNTNGAVICPPPRLPTHQETLDRPNHWITIRRNLYDACNNGFIQTVRDIVINKDVDINNTDEYHGYTPLMWASGLNQTEVVSFLLTQPELQLDKRNYINGGTVLHMVCDYNNLVSVVRLICQDRRCTPSVINIKDNYGRTALMRAVYFGSIDIVKEIEKVEGTDFDTKDRDGKTLIEVARMKNRTAVLDYLRDRKKNTLKGMAANSVANHIVNEEDIDALVDAQLIPKSLKPLVADFLDN